MILCLNYVLRHDNISLVSATDIWGYSSAGRALEWHSRGHGFKSHYLHYLKIPESACLFSKQADSGIFTLWNAEHSLFTVEAQRWLYYNSFM